MIDVQLVNGKMPLKINGEGEISVTVHTHPPLDESVALFPFSSYFEDSGSNDMRVDGSSNPVCFCIESQEDKDIFIKTISVKISDAGANLDDFAAKSALTNGISFEYLTPDLGQIMIQDAIKTNLDFIRLGFSTAGIGSGSSAFKADLSGGGADTYLPVIDLTQTFGLPWGLRLSKGFKSKLSFWVNDDLSSGISEFNIKAFGTQI